MATQQKRAKTGVYRFRKAVPERLRARLGKTEVIRLLHTKDFKEANIRFLDVAAEVEAEWATLSGEKPRLTKEELLGLAREFHERTVAKHADFDCSKAESTDRPGERLPMSQWMEYDTKIRPLVKDLIVGE